MYFGSLVTALRAAYPAKRGYRVVENNDPSGDQTKMTEKAKDEAQISAAHDSNQDA